MRDGPLPAGWPRLLVGGVLLAVAVVFLVLVLPSTFDAIATNGHGPLPRTRRANGPAWWMAVTVIFCAALAAAAGIARGQRSEAPPEAPRS